MLVLSPGEPSVNVLFKTQLNSGRIPVFSYKDLRLETLSFLLDITCTVNASPRLIL